jgi:hypothetical protein
MPFTKTGVGDFGWVVPDYELYKATRRLNITWRGKQAKTGQIDFGNERRDALGRYSFRSAKDIALQ